VPRTPDPSSRRHFCPDGAATAICRPFAVTRTVCWGRFSQEREMPGTPVAGVPGTGGEGHGLGGHCFQAKWYVVSIDPSVESIEMKLVTFFGSEVPAMTRSSVLMLKFRFSPHGW
jgi:hypothetical protein